jgi:hypothetical protein
MAAAVGAQLAEEVCYRSRQRGQRRESLPALDEHRGQSRTIPPYAFLGNSRKIDDLSRSTDQKSQTR